MKEKLNIIVFRNNLRVKDNYPLYFASKEYIPLLALYSMEIINEKNIFQKEFIKETLINLKSNLLKFNINISFVENISTTLEYLNKNYQLKIFFDEEVGVYEKNFEEILEKFPHKKFFTQTMIEPFSFDYNKSFSYFRKKAEKKQILKPLCEPNICNTISFDSIKVNLKNLNLIFKGGENHAISRLDYYLNNFIHNYKDTRDKVDGSDNSTKFSPYLSVGAISPRYIYYKIKEKELETYSSKSSYWIYFELLWRDFFHLVMYQSKSLLFKKGGLKNSSYKYIEDDKLFSNFFNCNCKVDLIDASIKELTTTGWLSNRNRQLVASFFIKNLGFNWLYCAKFFENNLIDYNPASNYGNFAYQAYVGNDSSYRVFDIYKQSKLYGGADYIQKWLNKKEDLYKIDLDEMKERVKKEVYQV